LFEETGQLSRDDYLGQWRSIVEEKFREFAPVTNDPNAIQSKLQANNIFYIARRSVGSQEFLYYSGKFNDVTALFELAVPGAKLCTKTRRPEYIPLLEQSIVDILSR